jgi:hypothetical protein
VVAGVFRADPPPPTPSSVEDASCLSFVFNNIPGSFVHFSFVRLIPLLAKEGFVVVAGVFPADPPPPTPSSNGGGSLTKAVQYCSLESSHCRPYPGRYLAYNLGHSLSRRREGTGQFRVAAVD